MSSVCIAVLSYVRVVEEELAHRTGLFVCRPRVFRERGAEVSIWIRERERERVNDRRIVKITLRYFMIYAR